MIPSYNTPGFSPPPMQLEVFAQSIDFRPNTESVDDQKSQGSCVAHGAQTSLEICYERAGLKRDFSRQYLYYYVRLLGGTLGQLAGGGYTSQIGEVMEAGGGVCLEQTWPYKAEHDGVEPPEGARIEARSFFGTDATKWGRVDSVNSVKRALNLGRPVGITMYVHRGMMRDLGTNWRTHTWDVVNSMPVGLHCVTVIGYDEACGRFLIENSWGSEWGDGGFFGMPYELFANPNCVVDAYAWEKLPVPFIPDQAYRAEDPATFSSATGVLTLPTVQYFPGDFGGAVQFNRVCLKITKFGTITTDDEMVFGNDNFIQRKTTTSDLPRMGLPRVLVDGVEFKRVRLIGLEFEILAGEPA